MYIHVSEYFITEIQSKQKSDFTKDVSEKCSLLIQMMKYFSNRQSECYTR